MDLQDLVRRYIDAWSRREIHDVLALMHSGAAYYDAFWRETCVGRDLVEYLRISFEDYAFVYRQVGDLVIARSSVVYRYTAHESGDGDVVFNGAEVLTIKDNKILTVSNHYCDPRRASLIDLSEMAETRHGETRFAQHGLSSFRAMRIKHQLATLMDENRLSLDSPLSLSSVVERLGCSVEQLFQVANVGSEAEFDHFLSQHGAKFTTNPTRTSKPRTRQAPRNKR